jgi:UrcA family protein
METTMIRPLQARFTAAICASYGVAALGLAPLLTANAGDDPPPTRKVSFADLDLNKAAGIRELYSRIQAAARQVCELDTGSDLHMQGKEHQACVNQAIDGAVRSARLPALADLRFGTTHLASR